TNPYFHRLNCRTIKLTCLLRIFYPIAKAFFTAVNQLFNTTNKKKSAMQKLQKLFLIPLLLIGVMVNAQTRTVKGKIVSAQNNQPVFGASVQIKGKTGGTVTGTDGTFSINVPAGNVTLVVTNVGYASVERTVESNISDITITLTESQ